MQFLPTNMADFYTWRHLLWWSALCDVIDSYGLVSATRYGTYVTSLLAMQDQWSLAEDACLWLARLTSLLTLLCECLASLVVYAIHQVGLLQEWLMTTDDVDWLFVFSSLQMVLWTSYICLIRNEQVIFTKLICHSECLVIHMTQYWPNIVLMLGHRLIRRLFIKPLLLGTKIMSV